MPLPFPSHQGLILPLARKWPRHFDGLALCVGAAMPDVVDGFLDLYRGHLGQWYGHTLLGLAAFCLPGGLLLTRLLEALDAYLARHSSLFRRLRPRMAGLARSSDADFDHPQTGGERNRLMFASLSVGAGALSHLLFDLVSHANGLLLYPWYGNIRIFPSWWYTSWFPIPVPLYDEPYPFGPHLVVWIGLSLLGAWLFFAPLLRKKKLGDREDP